MWEPKWKTRSGTLDKQRLWGAASGRRRQGAERGTGWQYASLKRSVQSRMHLPPQCEEVHADGGNWIGCLLRGRVRDDLSNDLKKKEAQTEYHGRLRSLWGLLQRHELSLLYLWRGVLLCKFPWPQEYAIRNLLDKERSKQAVLTVSHSFPST